MGILTIKDRVVQMVLKMLLEPIFEADFLECSYGFRPGRRTVDCLVPIWRHMNSASKHYWAVEGDIRACFDRFNHRILVGLLRKRTADQDVLELIAAFLRAGVMEGQLFQRTEMGVPQGGILSPLLSNLYLHQFDLWWWNKYGCLTRYDRRRRRRQGLGHPILIRYADDWLLLWNGRKEGALQLKEEAKAFLEQDLHLELSAEKTRVTHVDGGFTFLGFHVRRYRGTHGRPVVLIRPSPENICKLKAKIKALTHRSTGYQPAWYKVLQLNQILRGWSAYHQHVNAKATFSELDWWVLNRIFRWARKKHGHPPWKTINAKYRHRDPKGRINFVCRLVDESPIWLYRMSDRPIRRYWVNWQRSAYAEEGIPTGIEEDAAILIEPVNYPAHENDQLRLIAKRRDDFTCQHCQTARNNLDAHYNVPRKQGGTDTLDDLTTLCRQCHRKVHRTTVERKAEGEPCAGKLARTVREAARGKHRSGCASPC